MIRYNKGYWNFKVGGYNHRLGKKIENTPEQVAKIAHLIWFKRLLEIADEK